MANVERQNDEGATSKELPAAMGGYGRVVASDAPGFVLLVRRFGGRARADREILHRGPR